MSSPPTATTWSTRLRTAIHRVEVRALLTFAILTSLLPFDWIRHYDPLFLTIFGCEFGLRLFLAVQSLHPSARLTLDETQSRVWRYPLALTLLLLALDLLALASFLPLGDGQDGTTHWLRVLRLSRLLVLVGYWGPLVADLWSIVIRRERARQVLLMGTIVLSLSFAGALVVEHGIEAATVDFDDDGVITARDRSFWVRLWWAFRQIQDPGNMMSSPVELTAVWVSVALTVFGLFLVSFLIGLGTDVVGETLELSRRRPPGFHGHTVVFNTSAATRQLLLELMHYYHKLIPSRRPWWRWLREWMANARRDWATKRLVVVGVPHHPPEFLHAPELAHLTYREGHLGQDRALVRADVVHAARVVLLAELHGQDPDAATIQGLVQIVERRHELAQHQHQPLREQLVIAEILDEDNVPAARAAVFAGGRGMHVAVVPTERLIALFIACVARRRGIGRLLEELLSSQGREIYTWNAAGAEHPSNEPSLPNLPAMATMRRLGQSDKLAESVLPLGYLCTVATDIGGSRIRVHLNPKDDVNHDNPRCGVVALASNDRVVTQWARRCSHVTTLTDCPADGTDDPIEAAFLPLLERAATTSLHRVVIGGFRRGSVGLVEALLAAQADANLLVVVTDAAQLETLRLCILDHNERLEAGLLDGRHAPLRALGDDTWSLAGQGLVRAKIGDLDSTRCLRALPGDFGSIMQANLVILLSDEDADSDAKTTRRLLKIEALRNAQDSPDAGPRLLAEVMDPHLAHRLRRRFADLHAEHVRIYAIQELRAFFMFQSLMVPHFDAVYSELLGPWGQSFVRIEAREPLRGEFGFHHLADLLARRGWLLLGVEQKGQRTRRDHDDAVLPGREGELFVGQGNLAAGHRIDLGQLQALWVIAPDHGESPSKSQDES